MNLYNVYADYTEDSPKSVIQFSADDFSDAYFVAAQKIIDKYNDLSEESCKILCNSDMKNWITDCDKVFDLDGLNISDIEEIDNEYT